MRGPAKAACGLLHSKGSVKTRAFLRPAMAEPMPNLVSDADLAAIWVTNPDRVMFR